MEESNIDEQFLKCVEHISEVVEHVGLVKEQLLKIDTRLASALNMLDKY